METIPQGRLLPIDGDAVRVLRLRRKWDVDRLAREAECSARTIRNIEKGIKLVFACTLVAVAEALEVNHAELLVESMPVKPKTEEKRITGVTIHLTLNFPDVDASEELIERVNRIFAIAGTRSEIEVLSVKPGSILVSLDMSEEDTLRLVQAFGQSAGKGTEKKRLDEHHVSEISFPATPAMQQVAEMFESIQPYDSFSDKFEDSRLFVLGKKREWLMLKIAKTMGDYRLPPKRKAAAIKILENQAAAEGISISNEEVFATRLFLEKFQNGTDISVVLQGNESTPQVVIRQPPK